MPKRRLARALELAHCHTLGLWPVLLAADCAGRKHRWLALKIFLRCWWQAGGIR